MFKNQQKRYLIIFEQMKEENKKKEEDKLKKIPKATSFQKKASLVNIKETGEVARPHLLRHQTIESMTDKIYGLMDSYMSNKTPDIQRQIVHHVQYTLARTRFDFKNIHCYQAVAHTVRDRLIQYYNDTHRVINYSGKKKVYYISLQFLIGRCFQNALINLNIQHQFKDALKQLGYSLQNLKQKQPDAGLGNGGLGRLAACFLDSLATLNYPAWGYGIRYEYGIFRQSIRNGYQIETPDFWLSQGNPWEIERVDIQYRVSFYGNTRRQTIDGKQKVTWENCQTVIARAYDTPIPGYATFNTIGLRLWKSLPLNEFDFNSFNSGQYERALQAKQRAEYITSVLYPNDSTQQGKQLRLKQQYLLVSATIQDIIRRHKAIAKLRQQKFDWKNFHKTASIQLNDTHPALAIVQLMRILLDQQDIDRQTAWGIIYNTFSYTNHTVLPEALQKWSAGLVGYLLPRHLELIYLINHFWLESVSKKLPQQQRYKLSNLSIVQESNPKQIRMANLSIVGSHKVNGVAALHSQLIKKNLFKDFYQINPQKFTNVTNGVTTRRWIVMSNPLLAELYTQSLSTDQWLTNMQLLKPLQKQASNPQFQSKWQSIKQVNKRRLALWIKKHCDIQVDQNSMFDVQIKRIHEYKRQLMNILYVVYRYLWIKSLSQQERLKVVPRTIIFGGKAAPGYATAKKVIKFINQVGAVVNNDGLCKGILQVFFIPNYNVSAAQVIIPATQLSQHISTAGKEASGTSNMKFVLNGSLIIGTMDGANVQICQQVGEQNIFIFGLRQEEVEARIHQMRTTPPEQYIPESLKQVFHAIRQGMFGAKDQILSLISTIIYNNDQYLVTQDFEAYIECQKKADQLYKNKAAWTKMSILNAIRSGKFSSDRTIRQYSQKIWNLESCKVIQDIYAGKQNQTSLKELTCKLQKQGPDVVGKGQKQTIQPKTKQAQPNTLTVKPDVKNQNKSKSKSKGKAKDNAKTQEAEAKNTKK